MLNSNIACCYYPTTVAFIDDNKSFLDSMLLEIDENISACSYTNPTEAIKDIQARTIRLFEGSCLKSLKDNANLEGLDCANVEHGYVDIDIFDIHKRIYDPNRFGAIAVVVVDYTMPQMNGLETCRALSNLPLKFILLTGDATSEKAVEAFNDGLIHQYIQKSSDDFINKLQKMICNLQKKQFAELSTVVTGNLAVRRGSCLSDQIVQEFFTKFIMENNITEYYLINESGGFLLLDSSGNISWMVIKSEEEVEEYTVFAIDNYAEDWIIRELQNRAKLLFLFTEKEHIETSIDGWEKNLYPATKLVGQNSTYYFSHIKGMVTNGIFPEKITSYAEFLAKR